MTSRTTSRTRKRRLLGVLSPEEQVTAQFDADWLLFLDGKTVNDYKRVVRANVPFASHEQGQAWAEGTLERMHVVMGVRGLKGSYKFAQEGQRVKGQIVITCNVTRPPGAGGGSDSDGDESGSESGGDDDKPSENAPSTGGEMNRNITYQLQYMVAASGNAPANA